MPTIHQLTHALKICMFADDHVPPHFHVIGSDTECLVRISDLQVIEGTYRRRDLAAAMAWAGENIEVLERKWSELNERD